MANWKHAAHRVAARLERHFDTTRSALRYGALPEQVEIHPFRGYGTATTLHVMGRVLRQPRIATGADAGTPWSNLVETFRRFGSAEVASAAVVAEMEGVSVAAKTNDEGYFHLEIVSPAQRFDIAPVHHVTVKAIDPPSRASVLAEVMVPPPTAQFGVISDIDDTIVHTNATTLLRMARTVFMQNARGRVVMPGVPDLYRALHRGVTGSDANPFFYVSSSPWNFYDLLDQFLALHGLPAGPVMLQDYGIDDAKLVYTPHDDHKLTQIEEIFRTYPRLPFVLIGDSGQRDPEIYRTVAQRFPDRIRAIYIRDVSGADRDAAVRTIAAEVRRSGIEVELIESSDAIARHARTIGLMQ